MDGADDALAALPVSPGQGSGRGGAGGAKPGTGGLPARLPGPRLAAALVVALALLVRLAYLAEVRDWPLTVTLVEDELAYHTQARQIAAGDWLGDRVFYQSPLYPYFLAVVYRVAGPDPMAARATQAVLGALSCLLILLAARRLYGAGVGLIAGLIAALYGIFVFYDALILKASLVVLFSSLLLHALATRDRDGPPRSWLVPGACLGLLILVRGNAYGYFPFLVGWILVAHRDRRVARSLFLAAGAALVLLPVAARNWAVGGDLVLSESQAGTNFYIGNGPQATGTYVPLLPGRHEPHQEQEDSRRLAEAEAGRPLKPSEISRFWFREAFRQIGEHPGRAARVTLRKVLLFFGGYEIPDTQDFARSRDRSLVLKVAAFNFSIVLGLAVLGLWLGLRRPGGRLLPALLILAAAATVVPFYVFARYRLPAVPPLILLGAAAVPRVVEFLRGGRAGRVAAVVLVFAATVALANIPVAPASRALPLYNEAVALNDRGDRGGALRALGEAVAADPGFPESFLLRGGILRGLGRLEEAHADFTRFVLLTPGDARGPGRRAETAMDLGHDAAALEDYGKAILAEPRNSLWRSGRGIVHGKRGEPGPAAADFAAAIRLDPRNVSALQNLERVHRASRADAGARAAVDRAIEALPAGYERRLVLGFFALAAQRSPEAAGLFSEALAARPRDPVALNYRGLAHLQDGRPAEAAADFGAAAAADPSFADSFNHRGLARGKLGDARGAVEDFDRAVALAPRDALYHLNRADALTAAGRSREAVEAADAAIAIDPGNPQAYARRAAAHRALGRADLAAADEARAARR